MISDKLVFIVGLKYLIFSQHMISVVCLVLKYFAIQFYTEKRIQPFFIVKMHFFWYFNRSDILSELFLRNFPINRCTKIVSIIFTSNDWFLNCDARKLTKSETHGKQPIASMHVTKPWILKFCTNLYKTECSSIS